MPIAVGGGLFQFFLLVIDAGSCTVLADTDTTLRIFLVRSIRPLAYPRRIAAIPTEILIPANQIGQFVQAPTLIAGGRRRTRRVFPVGQFVQFQNVLTGIVARLLQFVEQSPETDRRMVEILANQFYQLLLAILPERRLVDKSFVPVAPGTDKGYFRPNHQSVAVAQVIHILILRIMCQTDGIYAHFEHNIHIFLMIQGRQSISDFCTILMTANSAKLQVFPVQKEAFIRVDRVITQAQDFLYPVGRLSILQDRSLYSITVWIFPAIPQPGLHNFQP